MFKGILKVVISYALMLFSLLLMISLVKFSPNDLAFYTTAINSSYTNILGTLGVQIASPFVFFYGYSSWIWGLFSLLIGMRILVGITPHDLLIRFALAHGIALLSSTLFTLFTSNFSFLTGGVFGALFAHILTSIIPSFIMIPIILALLIILLAQMWSLPFEQLAKKFNSLNKAPQVVVEQYSEYRDELPQYNSDYSELSIPINDNIEEISQQYHATHDENMHYGAVDTLIEESHPSDFRHRSQLPSFLQEIDEGEPSEQQQPVFICKKPLVTKKETLLRDVEVDLLSPYLRGSSSFYNKIEENNFLKSRSLEALESPTTLEEDVQNITEGLDELDQSFESMLPTSEWIRESGVPLSDFIRNQSGVKRLSFSDGIVSEVTEMSEISETQINADENENIATVDKKTDYDSEEFANTTDDADKLAIHTLIEDSADIVFDAEPSIIPQHISNFPPVSGLLSDTPIILNELDDKGQEISNFSLEHFENPTYSKIDNDIIGISDSEKILLSGIERTMKKQQESTDSLKDKLHKKQQELAEIYYKTLEQEENASFVDEELGPVISDFVLQDFEKEILALKKESNTLDTVSQNISDTSFLMTHKSSLDSEPVFDPLAQDPINTLVLPEKSIDSEHLIQELMIPNVEDIEDIENVDYLESLLEITPKEEKESIDFQTEEDLNIKEEYDIPNLVSLMRLNLGEAEFPDIKELTRKAFSPNNSNWNIDFKDFDKEETVLEFKDIFTQKDKPSNDINKIEKFEELLETEDPFVLLEESQGEIPIPSVDTMHSFSSELEREPAFVISRNDDENTQESNLLKPNTMTPMSIPTFIEDTAFSFSSEDSEREPEFTIRNINDNTVLDNNPPLEIVQKIAEPEEIVAPQTIIPEEIFIQDSSELTDIEFRDQEDNIALEKPIVFEESIIHDMLEEDREPTTEKDSEEMLNVEQEQRDIILSHEEEILFADEDSNEIYEIEQNPVDQDITDLDTPESLLMPSVTTDTHLIKTVEYPVAEQIVTQNSPKEAIFPNIEDLEPNTDVISRAEEDEEVETTMKMIEDTYESFNINMQVVDYNRGPTITRFELEPPSGLKLRTILNLQDDLALQAGTSNLRIISPVEGRSLIGIEVPNKVRRNFLLREQIESDLFDESQAELPLILGIDVGGKEIVSDLATTPHLLIAGTTGSGKSVYVNALIMGLLFKLSSEDLKFIMIDPKMVELELYNGIPHLLAPIITKPEEAMAALEWAVQEMDRRYKILSELSVRNIKEYKNLGKNSPTGDQGYEKLPYIVVIVDEFANLMLRAPKDTEKHISRLASMSRAVGIHLVLATQRPSVDVVTGVIKANFPSRIAFRVSSKIDSRTIIDRNGAETLLGRGDMLFMSPNYMDPVRIQSPYASSEDVARAVNTIKKNGPPDYAIDFSEVLAKQEENNSDGSRTDAMSDPLFEEVLRYAVDNGEISASGIQRRFRVGYNRASRLIESMKDMKIISPPPSAGKGWLINITRDEIQSYLD